MEGDKCVMLYEWKWLVCMKNCFKFCDAATCLLNI